MTTPRPPRALLEVVLSALGRWAFTMIIVYGFAGLLSGLHPIHRTTRSGCFSHLV
jgi:hypothetical protein